MFERRFVLGLGAAVLAVSLFALRSQARASTGTSPGAAPATQAKDAGKTSDDEVRSLLARLRSKEPRDTGLAYKLALAGTRAVPGLIEALSSNDSWVRSRAAKTLGIIGDSTAAPALMAMARQKDERYESALDSLGQIGGPDVAGFMLEILPKESPKVRRRLIGYLGLIGDNRAVPTLCDILAKPLSVYIGCQTAEALGRFRDQRSRDALRRAVREEGNWDVYRAAKKALLCQLSGKPYTVPEASLIETVIEKEPEPAEGAEEWLRQYEKSHPPSPKGMFPMSSRIHVFVIPACYNVARRELLDIAKHPTNATKLVEELLGYMRHSDIEDGVGQKAMQMIVEIGDTAVPALENAVKRGDETLKVNANACLRKIKPVN